MNILNRFFGKHVFAVEDVNTGRQIELDIAKGFAIVFMVWIHTTESVGTYQGLGNAILENFLGGPFAAPVFMVCMGIGMRYARKNTSIDFVKRGIDLLLIGLVLNIFRYVIPMLLTYAATGDGDYLNIYPLLLGVDILEFAGFAFLVFALVKKVQLSDKVLVVIAVVASLAGMILKGVDTGCLYLDQLLGYLWGNYNAETYFPFLNWIIFPVFGYVFGKVLRKCADKKIFYLKLSPVCGILGMAYLICGYIFKFGMYGENGRYYFLGVIDAFAILLLVLGILGFCYLLCGIKDFVPMRGLQNLSRNINTVYCIQWVIICFVGIFLYDFMPAGGLPFVPMTILAAVILVVSGLLAHWYQKKRFLSHKPVRIVVAVLLVITVVVSVIAQTMANPLQGNWYEFIMS